MYSTQWAYFEAPVPPWYLWEIGRKRSVWRRGEACHTWSLVSLFMYWSILSHWKSYELWQELCFSHDHVCWWGSDACFLHSPLDSGSVRDLTWVSGIARTQPVPTCSPWLCLHALSSQHSILNFLKVRWVLLGRKRWCQTSSLTVCE